MAITKMKAIKVFGDIDSLDTFTRRCCLNGTFEPEDATKFCSELEGFVSLNPDNPYTTEVSMLEDLSREFGVKLNPNKHSKFTPIEEDSKQYIQFLYNKIKLNVDKRSELQKQKELNLAAIANYQHFTELEINLSEILNNDFTKVRFGYISKKSYDALTYNIYKDIPYAVFIKSKEDKHGYWGMYVSPVAEVKQVDNVFRELGFIRAYIPTYDGTAQEAIEHLTEENKSITAKIDELNQEFSKFLSEEQEHYDDLYGHLLLLDSSTKIRAKAAINSETGHFLYAGWLEATHEKEFLAQTQKTPGLMVQCSTPSKESAAEVPVKLKNNPLFRPFEFFVKMFGLPKYGELDPTPFFAITYFFMFGLMFADVGQGIIVMIAGALMWKIKKMGVGPILVRCGISSTIFGFVFGSVFGFEELLDPLWEKAGVSKLPLHPFENTTTVLIFAVFIGIAFIYMVMLLNLYGNIKKRDFVEVFLSANGVAGLLTYTGAVLAGITFMSHKTLAPSYVIISLLGVGVLLLYIHKYFEEKREDPEYKFKPVSYILSGFIDIFEQILSFFSNTVSYLRLGAFVLVHAGMMMVVSALANMTTNIIVQVIIYILGNALVIVLEALLTAIQALRLEYYEMFSRFYSGDGREFRPAERYETK